MKAHIIIGIASACAVCGCQTRITAEKKAEVTSPVYSIGDIGGTNALYVSGYRVTSGGWYATARSPLWAAESLKGLEISVETNGAVRLALDQYERDLSTNAVTMTHNLMADGAELAAKIGAAVATAGGSAAADSTASAIGTLVAKFIDAGGDAENATVTAADGSVTVTDGSVTCTDGACYDTAE